MNPKAAYEALHVTVDYMLQYNVSFSQAVVAQQYLLAALTDEELSLYYKLVDGLERSPVLRSGGSN